ncbi:MAG: hypothetical protein ACRD2L_00450, partial [Terriglobia bacterium]
MGALTEFAKPSSARMATEQSIALQEEEAKEAAAREFAPGVLGFAQRILSHPLLQTAIEPFIREEAAMAGALEEMSTRPGGRAEPIQDRIMRALVRAGQEIAGKGERRGFAETFEKAGIPAGPSLSTLLSPLGIYTKTGEGAPLQAGGILDPTARGAAGTVLSIAATPSTYITLGTSAGLKIGAKGVIKTLAPKGEKLLLKTLAETLPAGIKAVEKLPAAGRELAQTAALQLGKRQVEKRVGEEIARVEAGTIAPFAEIQAPFKVTGQQKALELSFAGVLDEAVKKEADDILKSGFSATDPLYIETRKLARKKAEETVLAAASIDPKLLDRGGIKWMGLTIPGTSRSATILSGMTRRGIHAIGKAGEATPFIAGIMKQSKNSYDSFKWALMQNPFTKDLPGYNILKNQHIDAEAALFADHLERIEQSSALRWLNKQDEGTWRNFADAFETGDFGRLSPIERQAATELKNGFDEMVLREVELGALSPDAVRNNYLAHFYENTPTELKAFFNAWGGRSWDPTDLGRHAEERVYDTLHAAERASQALHDMDPSRPILKPIWNPVEVYIRRAQSHARAVSWRSWLDTVGSHWGGTTADFNVSDFLDLTAPKIGAPAFEAQRITAFFEQPRKPGQIGSIQFLKGLTDEGKEEFFRQRFAKVSSREEWSNTILKYQEHAAFWPRKTKPLVGEMAPDGTPYVLHNFGGAIKNLAIPESVARDLQGASRRLIFGEEASRLFRHWDQFTNLMRASVTVVFPTFNFRNGYSNLAQSYLEAGVGILDPRLHFRAIGVLVGQQGQLVSRKTGEKYSYEELRNLARQYQVTVTGAERLQQTGMFVNFSKTKGAPRAVAAGIENEGRMALWLSRIRAGEVPELAAQNVKRALFDYKALAPAEKEVFKRLFLFYTWPRKNIPLQIQRLAHVPGRQASLVKLFSGRRSEDEDLTTWDGQAFKIRLDRDGDNLTILSGIDLPIRDLNIIWRGSAKGTLRSGLGMLVPQLKVLAETAAGQSLFTGRGFARTESETAGTVAKHLPKPVQNFIGYKMIVDTAGRRRHYFDAERFNVLVQSFILSRFVS